MAQYVISTPKKIEHWLTTITIIVQGYDCLIFGVAMPVKGTMNGDRIRLQI